MEEILKLVTSQAVLTTSGMVLSVALGFLIKRIKITPKGKKLINF